MEHVVRLTPIGTDSRHRVLNHVRGFECFAELCGGDGGGLRDWYFAGRSSRYLSVLEYRWDNGFAFTSYRERVELALNRLAEGAIADLSNEATGIQAMIDARDALREEKDSIAGRMELSPQLGRVLDALDISIVDVMGESESDDEDDS